MHVDVRGLTAKKHCFDLKMVSEAILERLNFLRGMFRISSKHCTLVLSINLTTSNLMATALLCNVYTHRN